MYIINKDSNKLVKIEKRTFKSLGLDERHNLQEWIAKEPSSLGEELLIIQKEFDGFVIHANDWICLPLIRMVILSSSKTNWMTQEETLPGKLSNMPLIVPVSPKEM